MTLTVQQKRDLRALLFKHQDGLVVTSNILNLSKNGILDFVKDKKDTTLKEIAASFPDFHNGYLNVSLRCLASQGLFRYDVMDSKISIGITDKFLELKKFIHHYSDFGKLYPIQLELLKTPFKDFAVHNTYLAYAATLNALKKSYAEDSYFLSEIAVHLEGVLLIPMLVYLNYHSYLEDIPVATIIQKDKKLLALLENLGLLLEKEFTIKGQFLFDKSYAYGVTTSYLPIMTHLEKYLKGDFYPLFERDSDGNEQHVFRGINVWGSGGSHSIYFKKIDTILLDLFNRPIEEQPKGIIDVGCGNGALLEHMFNLIWHQTSRRDDLDKNKLILIGADYNKEALLSTQRNLKRADVWAEVVWGDIGNPAEIDEKLGNLYGIKLSDLLNIRSFLDHNRPFNEPIEKSVKSTKLSTGAFAYRGTWIDNHRVEQSLVEHFIKWKPYIENYGLLLIELHTISPQKVSLNLGKTPCTAYDVTHGFSDQYIVEIEVFNNAIEKAGLQINKNHYYKYPDSGLSTVSINLIS